jgi:hypothetical protein
VPPVNRARGALPPSSITRHPSQRPMRTRDRKQRRGAQSGAGVTARAPQGAVGAGGELDGAEPARGRAAGEKRVLARL